MLIVKLKSWIYPFLVAKERGNGLFGAVKWSGKARQGAKNAEQKDPIKLLCLKTGHFPRFEGVKNAEYWRFGIFELLCAEL